MRIPVLAAGFLVILASLIFIAPVRSNPEKGPPPESVPPRPRLDARSVVSAVPGAGVRKTPKLSSHLDKLYRVDILARSAGRPVTAMTAANLPTDLRAMTEARLMRLDERGRVQVFVDTFTDPDTALPELVALGFELQRTDAGERLLQGWLPIASLEQASKLDVVRFIRPPDYPVLNAGSVTSQGDSILRADEVRQALGVDGSGVRVGVISDGLEGLTASQSSGDLPAVNWTTCNMVPQNPTSAGAGAEGTAMLEIIHDLAPGAELWFGHFGMNFPGWGTSLDFMAAVDCLADHVDVIVDDIAFFNAGPYDGTSAVSLNAAQELNDPTNRVRGYYNAVGNFADRHYQEPYVDADPFDPGWNFHLFAPSSATVDAWGIGPSVADPVYLLPGQTIVVFLQWNDPFGASGNDYDLYLFRDTDGALVAWSVNEQSGTQDPVEWIVYTNPGPAGYFDILINRFAGAARTFDMFLYFPEECVYLPGNVCHNFNTAASSVPNNSDAGGGVVSLGAINASDPGNDTIAFYSSRGPTNDGRLKPDAVAIDGVSVTGAGGFPVPFYGTSAAAPHAGAIAALLLDCDPSLRHGEPGDDPAGDRAALRSALLGGAVDLGAAGADNTYGFGRLAASGGAAILCVDSDGDGLFDGEERILGTDPTRSDSDNDGCSDGQETGREPRLGGSRNPLDPWDFYDVPAPALRLDPAGVRDRAVGLTTDLVAVLAYVGYYPGTFEYDADVNGNGVSDGVEYDRSLGSPDANWRSGPPDGAVGVTTDVVAVMLQVGHSCAAAR